VSFDLVLARFDKGRDESPKHPGVLTDLLHAAQNAVSPDSIVSAGDDGFGVELEAGSGSVHPSNAVFQFDKLGKRDLRLIYDIATAGDMVVIVEGGKYPAILTDPRQRQNLPPDWAGDEELTPVAKSATHLGQLIRGALDAHEAYQSRVARIYDQPAREPLNPTPWRSIDPEERVVYVQVRPRERSITQLNRSHKYYRNEFRPRDVGLPKSSTVGGFGSIIQLPSGERFYGFTTSGDHEGWMNSLRAFAGAEGRLIGTIEGDGERFACEDGRIFALSECTYRPMTVDD
jgi:hypothetical protein